MKKNKCPKCGASVDLSKGYGVCSFCGTKIDGSLFVDEPKLEEINNEETVSFTCPSCNALLDGTPSRCPYCDTKIQYIAIIDDTDEKELNDFIEEEKVIDIYIDDEEEEVSSSPFEDLWPEDEEYYVLNKDKIKEKNITSIKRTIDEEDANAYLVEYSDGTSSTLSSKGMRLNGLLMRK